MTNKIKSATIQATGKYIYINLKLKNGDIIPATTLKGDIKQWSTFDTAIKWLKNKGIKTVMIDMEYWDKTQEQLDL